MLLCGSLHTALHRVVLTIGAADWHTTAWLDEHRLGEHRLGEHQGGYTPFSFDPTLVFLHK